MMRRNRRIRLGRRLLIEGLEGEEGDRGVVGVDAVEGSGVDGAEVEEGGSRGDEFEERRCYRWAMGDSCFREAVWAVSWTVIRDSLHRSYILRTCNYGIPRS